MEECMENIILNSGKLIGAEDLRAAIRKSIDQYQARPRRVLLIPPDFTRNKSYAGIITQIYYEELSGCDVDIMPALGTHVPMTEREIREFFGDIPLNRFFVHDWRRDVVKLGEISAQTVRELSEGKMDESIDVEVNQRLVSGVYDAIFSIGQVVPHEVAGMANYSKNIFIGCGGVSMINKTHWLGAVYGMERTMGKWDTPVRRVLNMAQEYLKDLPLTFVLTVIASRGEETRLQGLFIGSGQDVFVQAAQLSREINITHVKKPLDQVVVYLDADEFKTTWLGNKSIYRTRMALADGGRLVVLAPGVKRFGEDMQIDALIRKYGYRGTDFVLKQCASNEDLAANRSAAAHLIHGSSEGRFSISYAAPQMTCEEIEGVGFRYMGWDEAVALYNPKKLKDGFNSTSAGEVFYISNPALGLWEYSH
jgi:nickel-dependent lactate racemase